MPIVHGAAPSPFVRKVRVLLAEKGIDYQLVPVIPFSENPEYRRISPLGKIPAYQDGDFTLPDSSVICAYLERAHPQPALYPTEPQAYGRALWLEEYADTKVAETLGVYFFQRIVSAKVMRKGTDEEAVRRAGEKVPEVFDYLEAQLDDSGHFVEGRFTIADIAVATQLRNYIHAGESIDAARWPRLAAFAERIHARPSFKTCIEEEVKLLSSL